MLIETVSYVAPLLQIGPVINHIVMVLEYVYGF